MVTVQQCSDGRCMFCQADGEVLTVRFADGTLSGPLCWKDFKAALKARNQNGRKEEARAPAS